MSRVRDSQNSTFLAYAHGPLVEMDLVCAINVHDRYVFPESLLKRCRLARGGAGAEGGAAAEEFCLGLFAVESTGCLEGGFGSCGGWSGCDGVWEGSCGGCWGCMEGSGVGEREGEAA